MGQNLRLWTSVSYLIFRVSILSACKKGDNQPTMNFTAPLPSPPLK